MVPRKPGQGSPLRFGFYELDPETGELSKSGTPVHLPPQPTRVLVLLAGRPGELVTREEIRERIWGSETYVDFEQGLSHCIKQIRAALCDDAATARYIQTVPRRGYRFLAPVSGGESALASTPVPPATTARFPLRIATAGAVVALLLGGFLAWRVWRASQPEEAMQSVALTTFPGSELYPSFSPEGTHVAFTWTGPKQDNRDVYVQQIGSGPPLRLTTDPSSDFSPVWSPDGRWIAFLRAPAEESESEVRLIPPIGGPERRLTEIQIRRYFVGAQYLAWCADSRCLVVTDSQGEEAADALFVVSVESGEKRLLTRPQHPALSDNSPAVSPDGRSLVFRRNLAPFSSELHWLTLGTGMTASGESKRLTAAALDAGKAAWLPDGKEILFPAQGHLWRLAVEGDGRQERLPYVGEDASMPAVSRLRPGQPARLVYVRRFDDENIWRIESPAPGAPSTAGPEIAIASTRNDSLAKFSPDGHRVAFESNRSGEFDIWLADPDGANAVQLTSLGAETGSPSWSPDGRWIVFDSNIEGQFEIYSVRAEGGKPNRLTAHPANDHIPSFSRDGRWIYFSSNRSGQRQMWKMPAAGGEAIQVTHGQKPAYTGSESTDGRYLYYTQPEAGTQSLWRVPTRGGPAAKVVDRIVERAFVAMAQGVYYVDRVGRENRLQYLDFASGRLASVAHNLGTLGPGRGLSATPDGRSILYTRVESAVADLMLVENFR